MEYKPTIGLEIHAELKTKTKMFCFCKNDPDENIPNLNICPICMGHPGTLPLINKEAIKSVLMVGVALGGNITDESEFDRKNYFYPDIPKGYQITQYKYPFISGGKLCDVDITRIHLEEDTAKSTHNSDGYSLVDFNRAGVPLMELVTEPVINSAVVAVSFATELQKILQYLGVSNANMEKGEMRLEANISVSKDNNFGTKVEVKNLNSFRSIEKAINFEIDRQIKILESGQNIIQETRGWDDSKQVTFSQRTKENSKDYRYFPDPDLPKIKISEIPEFKMEALNSIMKETPDIKRKRFEKNYSIKIEDINFYINNRELSDFFEESSKFLEKNEGFQLLSNLIITDIASLSYRFKELIPKNVAELVNLFTKGVISSRAMKDILLKMLETDLNPLSIAEDNGLIQKNDELELEKVVDNVILENESVVSDYKNGKSSAIQYLLGKAIKATKGAGNPQILRSILEKKLVK